MRSVCVCGMEAETSTDKTSVYSSIICQQNPFLCCCCLTHGFMVKGVDQIHTELEKTDKVV